MAQPLDPYRTLGLAPGASADEIRRAYRRLAKANHPDSAGEAALPRFLAIQAAYEMLESGLAGRPVTGRRSSARPRPARPWDADPERTRATRDAYGRRRSGAGATEEPEPTPGGPAGGPASPGSTTEDASPPPSGAAGADTAGRRTRSAASRQKATLGSTTYDAAEEEPFEPDWSGGTWYGASSGTYWTINPKEYADPRKHGPEYQRRARRVIDGLDDPADGEASFAGEDLGEQDSESATGARAHTGFDGRWAYPDEDASSAPAADLGAAARTASTAPPPPQPPPPAGAAPSRTFAENVDRLLRGDVGITGRIGLAFLAWVPIGMAVSWIGGEVTGCGRFTASCVDSAGVWTALVQFALIAVFVMLPSLAAISAAGTLLGLAASVGAAVFLSATGGSRQPDVSSAILAGVMVFGYVAGAAFAAGRRLGWRRVP